MNDFFNMCEIETSLFNREFAEQDTEWNLIKDLYEEQLIKVNNKKKTKIPKVLHFIWLGGDVPEKYLKNMFAWKEMTGFDLEIWDDDNIKSLNMPNQYLFDEMKSYGAKSDIARYNILRKFGGLYVDTDFLCISDLFKFIHEDVSFYSGICLERHVQINNGLIGSAPNHPILEFCIKNCTNSNAWGITCKETLIQYQTGPWLLTAAILMYLKKTNDRDLCIYPSQVFYPFPAALRHTPTNEVIEPFIKDWSLAVHLWHSSYSENSHFSQVKGRS